MVNQQAIRTSIPARMDRLPWTRWHWLVVIALGVTWILDGLEVTIVGAIAGVLTTRNGLNFSATEVGWAASIYIAGAVTGALFFGYLTDRLGRKRLFMITLAVYLVSTVLTAFSFNFWTFALFRFFTGTGIGGEYAAINSAIDELIPARVRGWADLAINGSYWIGTMAGAASTLILLNPAILPATIGWRFAFGLGAILGAAILLVRRFVPESPRWLMIHGREQEAEEIVTSIENQVKRYAGVDELPPVTKSITIRPRGSLGFRTIGGIMLRDYPTRSILGFSLMMGQAFFYNAIFFTYALVLTTFYKIPEDRVGLYLIPFAIGNVLGPWTIGRLFDTIGRRQMISFTYIISGVLLAGTGYLFTQGVLDATTQTIAWMVIFFFASAGASAAYLTVSEVFPLEIRAMAIAFFYALGTGAGGFIGPVLFGALIQTKSVYNVFYGYLIGAVLMAAAGIIELIFGVKAERRSLEEIATPVSAAEEAQAASMIEGRPVQPAQPQPVTMRSRLAGAARTLRPGPSQAGVGIWTPTSPNLTIDLADPVREEADMIVRALREHRTLTGQQLAALLGARYWGPRRFSHALRLAETQGRIRRVGRGVYEIAEPTDRGGTEEEERRAA